MKVQQTTKKIKPITQQIFPQQDFDKKYKIKKIIGKGQYGYVAKAIRKKDNSYVAVKKLINVFENIFETKRLVREIILLKNCKHPNIVSLVDIFLPKAQNLQNFDTIYIVTEFCDGDLQKLFKMEETFLNIQDIKFIMYQIICGIKYLHSGSIIHRDLTPANILINGKGMEVKICDLGLARVVQLQHSKEDLNQQKNSSESQTQEDQAIMANIKEITELQKKALVKEMINQFQNIETQSLPSTPTQFVNQKQMNFNNQNDNNFCRKRSNTNQIIQLQKQQETFKEQQAKEQFDGLRGSVKNEHQTNKTIKKRKLMRLGSKRISEKEYFESQVNKQKNKHQCAIEEKKDKKNILKNSYAKLTLRVTTRWYRAPQIILLQKGYYKPVDVWSLGCLFGQLLKMQKSVCYNSMQRFPLFPGKYCYPLSPETLTNVYCQQKKQTSKLKNDQLFMIISTIGKPTQQEISFLTDQTAKQYIRQIQQFPSKKFKKLFPTISQQTVQILQNTLVFDPRKRMTIDELLKHKFFDSVRKIQLQKNTEPIKMDFLNQNQLTHQILKKHLIAQIQQFLE